MLLGFIDDGEVRSFGASAEPDPSHAFPLAMRAKSELASSCVIGGFDALLAEPHPKNPMIASTHP
jgi:hypothetical protein